MIKVLVIGSGGMLGSCFMESEFEGIHFTGVDYPQIDITSYESSSGVIKKVAPQIVINCAAYTNVDGCETEIEIARNVNVKGPQNIAKVCSKLKVKLIHISTDYVFDGTASEPYEVDHQANPQSVYGQTKRDGELAVINNCEDYIIARTSWLYGEHGNNFIETIINASRTRDELKVVDDQKGSPTYVKDLVEAIISLCKKDERGIYHITNEGICTWYGFTCEIFRQLDIKTVVKPCTTEEFPRPAKRPAYSVLSKEKLLSKGIPIRNWDEALVEYLGNRKA